MIYKYILEEKDRITGNKKPIKIKNSRDISEDENSNQSDSDNYISYLKNFDWTGKKN